jgi:hypothetical protein
VSPNIEECPPFCNARSLVTTRTILFLSQVLYVFIISLVFFVPISDLCSDISSSSSLLLSVTSYVSTDLYRPRPTVSSVAFHVTSVHSLYNSALFFPSCCCPFLLHVAANLICIFLVYRQLVLVSVLTKFLHSFYCQKRVYSAVILKYFISIDFSRFNHIFYGWNTFIVIIHL